MSVNVTCIVNQDFSQKAFDVIFNKLEEYRQGPLKFIRVFSSDRNNLKTRTPFVKFYKAKQEEFKKNGLTLEPNFVLMGENAQMCNIWSKWAKHMIKKNHGQLHTTSEDLTHVNEAGEDVLCCMSNGGYERFGDIKSEQIVDIYLEKRQLDNSMWGFKTRHEQELMQEVDRNGVIRIKGAGTRISDRNERTAAQKDRIYRYGRPNAAADKFFYNGTTMPVTDFRQKFMQSKVDAEITCEVLNGLLGTKFENGGLEYYREMLKRHRKNRLARVEIDHSQFVEDPVDINAEFDAKEAELEAVVKVMSDAQRATFKPLSDWYYLIDFLEDRIDKLHTGPCDPFYNYSDDREWMEDVLWQGQDAVTMEDAIKNVQKFSEEREKLYAEYIVIKDEEGVSEDDKLKKLKAAESQGIRRDRATIQILVNLKYELLKKYGFYTTNGARKINEAEMTPESLEWYNAINEYIAPVKEYIMGYNRVNYAEETNRQVWYNNEREEVELTEEQIKNVPVYDINYRQTTFEHDTIIFCKKISESKDSDWCANVTNFVIGDSWFMDSSKTKDQWYIIRNESSRRCARFPEEFKVVKGEDVTEYKWGVNCIKDPEGMWVGLSQPTHPENEQQGVIQDKDGNKIGYTRHYANWGWTHEKYGWLKEKAKFSTL